VPNPDPARMNRRAKNCHKMALERPFFDALLPFFEVRKSDPKPGLFVVYDAPRHPAWTAITAQLLPFRDLVRRASGSQVRWEPDDPLSWRGPESEAKPAWFWFHIRAFCRPMAPVCALMRKLAKNLQKIGKKVRENGAKWRFFEGPKRHFAGPAAEGHRSQPGSLPDLTSVESGRIQPPPAPGIGGGAPFGAGFHPG
jgi:hypothetical protein